MSEKTKALVLHNSIYIEQILQIGVKRKKNPLETGSLFCRF